MPGVRNQGSGVGLDRLRRLEQAAERPSDPAIGADELFMFVFSEVEAGVCRALGSSGSPDEREARKDPGFSVPCHGRESPRVSGNPRGEQCERLGARDSRGRSNHSLWLTNPLRPRPPDEPGTTVSSRVSFLHRHGSTMAFPAAHGIRDSARAPGCCWATRSAHRETIRGGTSLALRMGKQIQKWE